MGKGLKGWAQCGVDASLLQPAQKSEAINFCLQNPERPLGEEEEEEDPMAHSDSEEEEELEEMWDGPEQ